MQISASALRQDIYKILDSVIETGTPVEIIRKGQKILIVKENNELNKLNNLMKREIINTKLEDVV